MPDTFLINTLAIARLWLITGIQDGDHYTGSGNNFLTMRDCTAFPTSTHIFSTTVYPTRICPCQHCPTSTDYRNSRWRPLKPEAVATILNSGNQRMSDNVGSITGESGTVTNVGFNFWFQNGPRIRSPCVDKPICGWIWPQNCSNGIFHDFATSRPWNDLLNVIQGQWSWCTLTKSAMGNIFDPMHPWPYGQRFGR